MSQDAETLLRANPIALSAPDDADLLIQSLLAASSPFVGAEYLDEVVRSLGTLFDANTTFLARRLNPDEPIVRVLAAWKDGDHKESWDYDMTGNPCQLPYDGDATLIPCDVMKRFEKKKDSGYESFVGLPLHDESGAIFGHIAIYNSKRIADDPKWLKIAALFAGRVEAEVHRLALEEARENTIQTLEQVNTELDQVNRLKSLYLGTAAHDLRNPLSIIGAYARLITSDQITDVDVTGMAERISVATDRMVALIDSYLDVASIESGELQIKKAPVLLENAVREKLDFLETLARVKGIEVRTVLDPVPVLQLDALRIEQIIDNLVGNAIKFSPQDSGILIALSSGARVVRLTVSDQGPGIAQSAMDDLFQPFVTGGANATANEKSTGLGLAIVRRIVLAHDGEISAENLPSSGARFEVTLPLDS